MLATFRNHAKGWIAWVFVILVSVPFAFWGVSQYRSLITTDYVAKVNGEKIMPNDFQRAYQSAYQRQQSQLGDKFDPSVAQQKALKEQVLQGMINQALLHQQASADGLVAGKADVQAQISQIPAFQTGGHFNIDQYRAVLAANGMTTSQFESEIRSDVTVGELQQGIARSAFAIPLETDAVIGLLKEQRTVAWFSLPLSRFKPSTPPSDDEIQAYYKAHQDLYSVPETLKIAFVRLDQKTLEGRVKVTDADVQSYYDTHQSQYGIPAARKAAEILIKPKGSDPKAVAMAAAQAQVLLTEIGQAADPRKEFADLARKASADKVSSRNGGAIGWVGRGQMPGAFDKALFGIDKVGGVAGPVQTKDGFVLIQLLGERGGSVKPYDQIKQQVASDYRAAQAQDLYYQLGDQLANIAYEHPDSLGPVAKALGLKVQTLSGVTRSSGPGIAAKEAVRKAAFSDSVLKGRQNSEPVKLGADDAVVLRVTDETAAHPKPLDKVHDQIVAALDQQKAVAGAQAAARQAVTSLRQGKSINKVALDHGVAAQGPQTFTRDGSSLPPPVTQAVFSMPPRGDKRASVGSAALRDGGEVVYALLAVKPASADSVKSEDRHAYNTQLAQLSGKATTENYLAWLRSQANIKIAEENIP